MAGKYKVSVIIPTYQRRKSVRRLLAALNSQTLPAGEFEVIVSIDGSTDYTGEMVAEFVAPYALRSLWQPNRGRAAACNNGIKAAQGEVLVLLDDDMEPAPGLLEAHYQAHCREPRLGLIGAVPVRYDRTSPPVVRYIGAKFNRHLKTLGRENYTLNLRDFYSGNFSIRRETMLELSGYDEDFEIYGNEDLELFLRLRKGAVTVKFDPAALAYQHYTKRFAGLARDNIAKGQTAVLLAKKHPETFKELKLSAYRQTSRKWFALRAALLGLSRLSSRTPERLIRFSGWLEKRFAGLPELYYTYALDYLYWWGAIKSLPGRGRPEKLLEPLAAAAGGRPPQAVVHFSDSLEFGGAERSLLNLLANLDRTRWQPTLVHYPIPGPAQLVNEAQALGVETWQVPPMPEGGQGALRALKFAAQLRRKRPAVFHAHLTWPRGCKYGLLAALLARVPAVIATEQLFVDTRLNWSMYLQQRLLGWGIDRFIAVSREVAARLNETYRVPWSKLSVITNGIMVRDFETAPDPALRARFVESPEQPLVLTLARLDKQKGHTYLLQAAAQVPHARFLLVGEGQEREKLADLARELGIADRVIFAGHRRDIAAVLAISDIVVLPSLFEGLPLSILEAMAAGKPVIATDIGGTREAIVDGETGLLVPPANPGALADAICRLLEDPAYAAKVAAAASVRLQREFSAESMTGRITRIYQEVLDPARGACDGAAR